MARLVLIAALTLCGCRFGFDAHTGAVDADVLADASATADGAADASSSGIQPLARWRLNEASAGQPATLLLDDRPAPVHLPLDYFGASPVWGETASGRFLEFAGIGADTGGARTVASGTKLDSLHGLTAVTVETKHQWTACEDTDPRIIEVTDGVNPGNSWLSVRENLNREVFVVRMSDTVEWSIFTHEFGGGCPTDGPHVVHWVLDTTAPQDANFVRAYVDGVRVIATAIEGIPVERDATLDLGAGERRVSLSRPHTGMRRHNGRVFYAAIYPLALPDAVIAANAQTLLADDD